MLLLHQLLLKKISFDIIHAHDWLAYPAGIAAMEVSGKPLVIHVHATDFDRSGGNVNPDVYHIEKSGMDAASKIITVSNLTRDIVINKYNIDPNKVDILELVLAGDSADLRAPFPEAQGDARRARGRTALLPGRVRPFPVLPLRPDVPHVSTPFRDSGGIRMTFGRVGLGLKLTLALLPVACLAGFSGARDPGLRRMYPFAKDACSGTGRFVGYEVSYFFFYYLPWESVFRGVLFFPLVPAIGLIPALAVQTGAVTHGNIGASRQGDLLRSPLGPGLRTGARMPPAPSFTRSSSTLRSGIIIQSRLPSLATGEGVRILVTGATGLGFFTVLVPKLVARHGAGAVGAFVLPGDAIPATWRDSGVRLFKGDIADAAAVRAAVAGHDRVVHMAGLISYWEGG